VSDFEARQNRRNLIVGIFVFVGMLSFGWLVFKFGDMPSWFAKWRSFDVYVQFRSAPGVQKDTPVRFCGYQIGRVTFVSPPQLLPEIVNGEPSGLEYHQTEVTLSIEKRFNNIPSTSQVKLMTRGLGSSFIEINPPAPDANYTHTTVFTNGSHVQGATGMTSEFFPEESQRKLEELVDGLKQLVGNANDIVGDPNNKENVKAFMANLVEASQQLSDTLAQAISAIDAYEQLAGTGSHTLQQADVKMAQLTDAIVSAAEELSRAGKQMRSILLKVNEDKGTLGKFVNDGRFYEELLDTTAQLQGLVEQLSATIEAVNEDGLKRVWKSGAR